VGPLYFYLVIIELLKTMKLELVLAYLDDFTLADDTETVLKDQLGEAPLRITCHSLPHLYYVHYNYYWYYMVYIQACGGEKC